MGTILAAIENSAIKEIEAEGMLWRVRKICSADLARVGHAALAMAQGMETIAPSSKKAKKTKSDEVAAAEIAAMPVDSCGIDGGGRCQNERVRRRHGDA